MHNRIFVGKLFWEKASWRTENKMGE